MTKSLSRIEAKLVRETFQFVHEICLFPAEATILGRGPPEMSVSRGWAIDRLIQLEVGSDAFRGQVEQFAQRRSDAVLVCIARIVRVHIDLQGLGDADGIADLNGTAVSKSGGHDILGEVARGVRSRPVNF